MQDIHCILSQAADIASTGDYQQAISLYQSVFTQSQQKSWIGGMFCSSKRLGDIYSILGHVEYSITWYQRSCEVITDDSYYREPLIKETVLSIMHQIVNLAKQKEGMEELAAKMDNQIQRVAHLFTQTKTAKKASSSKPSCESYDSLVKKQDMDSKLYDSFFNGCKKKSSRTVLHCIHKGVDVNYINPQTKYTALHNACWRGYKDIVSILLRHGADMTITNSEGETAMQCAEIAKKEDVVSLLKRVQNEGIGFLGACNECEKRRKVEKGEDEMKVVKEEDEEEGEKKKMEEEKEKEKVEEEKKEEKEINEQVNEEETKEVKKDVVKEEHVQEEMEEEIHQSNIS